MEKEVEVQKYKLQTLTRNEEMNVIKQKLEKYFKFKIVNYLIDDILENETYHHFCSLVALAVINNRLSLDDGETLKKGLKEIFEVRGAYDQLDKSIIINSYGCIKKNNMIKLIQ